jgi:hypothetical protein
MSARPGWTPKQVKTEVSFRWELVGVMHGYRESPAAKIWAISADVSGCPAAGVYRITIFEHDQPRLKYIGESGKLLSRVWQHARRKGLVHSEIWKALDLHMKVEVEVATRAMIKLRRDPHPMNMHDIFHRRLLENIAIAAEDDAEDAESFLMLNRSEENNFWLKAHAIGGNDDDSDMSD